MGVLKQHDNVFSIMPSLVIDRGEIQAGALRIAPRGGSECLSSQRNMNPF